MSAEGRTSRRRVIGISAAVAGVAAATAGIIGYARRHRHLAHETELPVEHTKIASTEHME